MKKGRNLPNFFAFCLTYKNTFPYKIPKIAVCFTSRYSLPPLDVLTHLLLSETIFSPLPLRTAEISSVGGSMDLFWNDPFHFFSISSQGFLMSSPEFLSLGLTFFSSLGFFPLKSRSESSPISFKVCQNTLCYWKICLIK